MISKIWWSGHSQCCSVKTEVVCAWWQGSCSEMMAVVASPSDSYQKRMPRSLERCSAITRRPASRQRTPKAVLPQFPWIALCLLLLVIQPSAGYFINFDNCLSPNIVNSNQRPNDLNSNHTKQLQFVPLFFWVTFDSTAPSHNLNVTAYGNVDGLARQVSYPQYTDPSWKDPNNDTGKIPDLAGEAGNQKFTTFTTKFNVLDYTPYNPDATRFCNTSAIKECPLAPVFNFTGTSYVSLFVVYRKRKLINPYLY